MAVKTRAQLQAEIVEPPWDLTQSGDALTRDLVDSAKLAEDLGGAADLDVGTVAGTVAAGDHDHAGVYEPADATILKNADIGSTVQGFDADIPTVSASQAEMEAGVEAALRSMSPLRVKQAIDALAGGGGGGGWTRTTAQATTSGTAFDFTGIPAGVSEIVVSFQGISLSGTENFLIQLGDAGGFETTGYHSASWLNSAVGSTAGFIMLSGADAFSFSGEMLLHRQEGNKWVSSHGLGGNRSVIGGGGKELSAELTQLRLTSTGSDTFDAGEVNIMYR